MENVKSIVKNIIGKDMKNSGYKAYSNTYYCHIGGVIKGFKIYSNNLHYTIRFGCYPLCSGMKRDRGIFENHEIACLLPQYRDVFLYVIPWGATITDKDQADAWENRDKIYRDIAHQLVDELRTSLLPKLLKIDSPKSAFDFETECAIASIRHGRNNISEEEAKKNIPPHYYMDCVWYLQMRDFQKAKTCLENWLDSIKAYYEQNDSYGMTYYDQQYSEQKALCAMLTRGSSDEIEKYIAQQEDITLKNFVLKR